MAQSLSSILIHLVFSTKNREPFITPAIETELRMKKPEGIVAVVGLGYVGLPLAASLAHHLKVIGFDINTKRVDELSKGVGQFSYDLILREKSDSFIFNFQ